jgi:hypothetical protein
MRQREAAAFVKVSPRAVQRIAQIERLDPGSADYYFDRVEELMRVHYGPGTTMQSERWRTFCSALIAYRYTGSRTGSGTRATLSGRGRLRARRSH